MGDLFYTDNFETLTLHKVTTITMKKVAAIAMEKVSAILMQKMEAMTVPARMMRCFLCMRTSAQTP